MIDAHVILVLLSVLAIIGFIIGAICSIWFGPMAMLLGFLGLPVAVIILALILVILGRIFP